MKLGQTHVVSSVGRGRDCNLLHTTIHVHGEGLTMITGDYCNSHCYTHTYRYISTYVYSRILLLLHDILIGSNWYMYIYT